MKNRKTAKVKAQGRRTKRLSIAKQTLRDLDAKAPGLKGGEKVGTGSMSPACRRGPTVACAV